MQSKAEELDWSLDPKDTHTQHDWNMDYKEEKI
jgi:hypothetical protein